MMSCTMIHLPKSIIKRRLRIMPKRHWQKAKETRVTLVILDIDHFKSVNDTYGHLYGDKVLSRVGYKLKEIVGDDGVVGRIGGDEF